MHRLLYNNGMNKIKDLPCIKMGPFRTVKYYQADVTAPDAWFDAIAEIGKTVITREELFNAGVNHILVNAIDNKFELESVGTVVAERNRQAHQKLSKNKKKK